MVRVVSTKFFSSFGLSQDSEVDGISYVPEEEYTENQTCVLMPMKLKKTDKVQVQAFSCGKKINA